MYKKRWGVVPKAQRSSAQGILKFGMRKLASTARNRELSAPTKRRATPVALRTLLTRLSGMRTPHARASGNARARPAIYLHNLTLNFKSRALVLQASPQAVEFGSFSCADPALLNEWHSLHEFKQTAYRALFQTFSRLTGAAQCEGYARRHCKQANCAQASAGADSVKRIQAEGCRLEGAKDVGPLKGGRLAEGRGQHWTRYAPDSGFPSHIPILPSSHLPVMGPMSALRAYPRVEADGIMRRRLTRDTGSGDVLSPIIAPPDLAAGRLEDGDWKRPTPDTQAGGQLPVLHTDASPPLSLRPMPRTTIRRGGEVSGDGRGSISADPTASLRTYTSQTLAPKAHASSRRLLHIGLAMTSCFVARFIRSSLSALPVPYHQASVDDPRGYMLRPASSSSVVPAALKLPVLVPLVDEGVVIDSCYEQSAVVNLIVRLTSLGWSSAVTFGCLDQLRRQPWSPLQQYESLTCGLEPPTAQVAHSLIVRMYEQSEPDSEEGQWRTGFVLLGSLVHWFGSLWTTLQYIMIIRDGGSSSMMARSF
ncbi:hypothetical protein C8Q80DRAFT_1122116 [Daedaleopsis nitida]|nr:hypothetical protein C8Q80DRAFT_1122116 [Daedaleopsis nitida]